jgi:predicted GNAT family acetyltransferase
MGEREELEVFWAYYAEAGQTPRLICRELLYEQRWPVAVRHPVTDLRQATPADLGLVMPVQARMAYEESGVDPLERDPEGFRRRCARRIGLGRTWVWVQEGKLVFKAEIIAETPQVIYLEGIYVDPGERGKGYGMRCLSQLGRDLLKRADSLCLFVNRQNRRSQSLYRKCNFRVRGHYDTIFLHRQRS